MTNLISRNDYYQIALARLNNEFSEKIEGEFPVIDTLDNDELKNVQDKIVEAVNQQDRFKVYHITRVVTIDYPKLEKFIHDKSSRYDFLIENSYSDWSVKGVKCSENEYDFSFSKFTIKYIKNPDEAQRITIPLVKIPYYFQFLAKFKREKSVDILTLSFPSFRPNPYGNYEFDQEINYIYSWVNNIGVELARVDYKGIFDSLDEKKFDKFGFKGEDLKNENDIIKSAFTIKHNNREEHSSAMHKTIDRLVGQEMTETILSGLLDVFQQTETKLPTGAEQKIMSYLGGIEFSKKFFASIQMGCEHGVGYAKYTQLASGDTFEYNLEYTKTGEGLIRSRTEKWASIEPIYGEIVEYFKSN